MSRTQAKYKQDYDRVSEAPVFHTRKFVFLVKPPLISVLDSQAKTLGRESYNKLHSRTTGPFRNVSVHINTVTIDEDVVQNTLSVDRVTHAPLITMQTQRIETSAQLKLSPTKRQYTQRGS